MKNPFIFLREKCYYFRETLWPFLSMVCVRRLFCIWTDCNTNPCQCLGYIPCLMAIYIPLTYPVNFDFDESRFRYKISAFILSFVGSGVISYFSNNNYLTDTFLTQFWAAMLILCLLQRFKSRTDFGFYSFSLGFPTCTIFGSAMKSFKTIEVIYYSTTIVICGILHVWLIEYNPPPNFRPILPLHRNTPTVQNSDEHEHTLTVPNPNEPEHTLTIQNPDDPEHKFDEPENDPEHKFDEPENDPSQDLVASALQIPFEPTTFYSCSLESIKKMAKNLDYHMSLALLENLEPTKDVLKLKLKLLSKTNRIHDTIEVYKRLYHTTNVPEDMNQKISEIEVTLEELKKAATPAIVNENKMIDPDEIEALYKYAKFEFQSGNYSAAAGYLHRYLDLNDERKMIAMWGKLAAEILKENWDIALQELDRLKEIIDSECSSSPLVESRIRLMHWSLFIFFNHGSGRMQIIDLFGQDRYLSAIQTSAPHLLRYLATAFILNGVREPQLTDFLKVIQQQQHSCKDPIIEFVACVYIRRDCDEVKKKMGACVDVILNDPFLGKLDGNEISTAPLIDEFVRNARQLILDMRKPHSEALER